MTAQTRYVIMNTNKNRGAMYMYNGELNDHAPWWLEGDFVVASSGACHDDISRATLYLTEKTANAQCKRLNEKFCIGGEFFEGDGIAQCRYPDSIGKEGYAKVAPTYVVKEVLIDVRLK